MKVLVMFMLTKRDIEILNLIGKFGFMNVKQIAKYFSVCQKRAYKILARLSKNGFLYNKRFFHGEFGVYCLMKKAADLTNHKMIKNVNIATLNHDLSVIDVFVSLSKSQEYECIITDREMRLEKNISKNIHVPDLIMRDQEGNQIAIEIELSIKSHSRTKAIIQFFKGAVHYYEVWYFCNQKTYNHIAKYVNQNNRIFKLFNIGEIDGKDTTN